MGMIVADAPGGAAVPDPAEKAAEFRYWQWRIMLTSMIGYAFFYFVRTNFSFAIPGITAEFGYSKEDLGWCITAHGLLYGVSRFANGILADRTNARWFMAGGLAVCGVINLMAGFSSTLNGIISWAPTFLKQARGFELSHEAGWTVGAFELAGILGMLSSGWITDRVFGGRGTRACLVYMTACGAAILVVWMFPSSSVTFNALILAVAGFFIYCPQCLIGIAAANLATKRAAASAGLTGLFGYASTLVSGAGIGWLADNYGWNAVFVLLAASAGIGSLLLVLCLPAKAHGYE